MYWKMSIDLSYPQVLSMGQHDPLEGFIACRRLQATAARLGRPEPLRTAAADFAAMAAAGGLATADPLGIGGLLTGAARLAQLPRGPEGDALVAELVAAALEGLWVFVRSGGGRGAAEHRLGFRELGLAIPLAGLESAGPWKALDPFRPLASGLVSCWRDPAHRRARSWTRHLDISEVMLAASLVPEGVLDPG